MEPVGEVAVAAPREAVPAPRAGTLDGDGDADRAVAGCDPWHAGSGLATGDATAGTGAATTGAAATGAIGTATTTTSATATTATATTGASPTGGASPGTCTSPTGGASPGTALVSAATPTAAFPALDADFYQQLVESNPDAIVVVDGEGVIRLVNTQAERLFGWSRRQLVGQVLEVLVPERLAVPHVAHRQAFSGAPRARPMSSALQLAGRHADGSEFPVDVSLSALDTPLGAWVSASVRDATARQRSQQELRRAYARASASVVEMERRGRELALLGEMGDMLQSCLDTGEAYAVVAAFVAQLFPGTSGVVYRPTDTRLVLEAGARWGTGLAAGRSLSTGDCWALRRGRPHRSAGSHRALRCRHDAGAPDTWSLCVPLVAHGDMVGLLHLASTSTGDDDAAAAEEEIGTVQRLAVSVAEHLSLALANLALREHLRSQSERDVLTGLYNRRHLEQIIEESVAGATRAGRPVGVLLVDVDGFKAINDRDGHAAGDTHLRQLATLLLRETRGGDTVFRIGGDEFVVLLPGGDAAASTARAEHIRSAIERQLGATVSIGVAALPGPSTTAEELLHEADICLYRAKGLGRNRVVASPPSDSRPAEPARTGWSEAPDVVTPV